VKAEKLIAAHVSPAVHQRIKTIAAARGITVSSLVGEVVEDLIERSDQNEMVQATTEPPTLAERLTIRLRPGDRTLVERRASARRMKPSTYIAALVRSHLVEDPPLPPAELAELERAVAEVSAIGRNLNQIARALNAGAIAPPTTVSIIGRSIEAVEAVREAARSYVRKAVASWEAPLG